MPHMQQSQSLCHTILGRNVVLLQHLYNSDYHEMVYSSHALHQAIKQMNNGKDAGLLHNVNHVLDCAADNGLPPGTAGMRMGTAIRQGTASTDSTTVSS